MSADPNLDSKISDNIPQVDSQRVPGSALGSGTFSVSCARIAAEETQGVAHLPLARTSSNIPQIEIHISAHQ